MLRPRPPLPWRRHNNSHTDRSKCRARMFKWFSGTFTQVQMWVLSVCSLRAITHPTHHGKLKTTRNPTEEHLCFMNGWTAYTLIQHKCLFECWCKVMHLNFILQEAVVDNSAIIAVHWSLKGQYGQHTNGLVLMVKDIAAEQLNLPVHTNILYNLLVTLLNFRW